MNDTNPSIEDLSRGSAMLQAKGLRRVDGAHVLLDIESLFIRGGDRIGIVGPTGSGKTLLLRSLALLDPLDAGEVRWNGSSVEGSDIPKFRSQVLYLHQRPALIEGTVEDNLQQPFALRIHKDKRFDRERVIAFLSSLGRDAAFLSKEQRDLSGGESQLVALLRAIQLDPSILLLDESSAALDAEATRMFEELVTRWLDEQPNARASVWVTHDAAQTQRVSRWLMHIREGKVSGGEHGIS